MRNTSTPRKADRFGLVSASPTEYLVLQRLGRLRFPGRGAAAWVIPGLERAYLIPSGVQSAAFRADQITLENQGVEISGFAVWNIADPAQAVEAVDFTDPARGLSQCGEQLREVVEAAIRREVANLSLEQVLRQRAAMTDLLRDELADVADRLGVSVLAVEIKTVEVSSEQLFENMQARFRDAVRLESARSAMETDEAIAGEKAAARAEEARREQAFRLAEIEREEAAAAEEIARDQRLDEQREKAERERELANMDGELALAQAREERSRAGLEARKGLIEIEEELESRRHRSNELRAEQRERVATIDDAIARREIETANTADPARLLLEALPGLFDGVDIGAVNLGDPALVAGLQALLRQIQERELPEAESG